LLIFSAGSKLCSLSGVCVINETKKRPVNLLDHLPPPRLSNAAVQADPLTAPASVMALPRCHVAQLAAKAAAVTENKLRHENRRVTEK
jgi:hypothetical protein